MQRNQIHFFVGIILFWVSAIISIFFPFQSQYSGILQGIWFLLFHSILYFQFLQISPHKYLNIFLKVAFFGCIGGIFTLGFLPIPEDIFFGFFYGFLFQGVFYLSLLFSGFSYEIEQKYSKNSKRIYWIMFFLLLFLGTANIFTNLGNMPFHQDENYHFLPALSLEHTGELNRWDVLNDRPGDPLYADRNRSLTFLVVLSHAFFGVSEFSSRLPVAIAGFLGIFAVFFGTKILTKNSIIALTATYLYSINDIILYFSRFLRGYIFLMIFAWGVFFFLYRSLQSSIFKKQISYFGIAVILFMVALFEFHATIIFLFPAILLTGSVIAFQNFPFQKYSVWYALVFLLCTILILNILGVIYLFPLPFGIQNQISLKINILAPQTIYFFHLSRAFHFGIFLIVFLIPLFFLSGKKSRIFGILGGMTLFLPLFFSMYFFNRYEDFRYISVLQILFIFYVSYFFYVVSRIFFGKYYHFGILFLLMIFSIFQAPYFPKIPYISQIAQAHWKNTEGIRLHFRAAQPDNLRAFTFLFSQNSHLVLVRLADGGLNWDDGYYFSKLKNTYGTKLIYYKNVAYESNEFDEYYNFRKMQQKYFSHVDFNYIKKNFHEFYVLENVEHLVSHEIRKFIESSCENISPSLGITQFQMFPNSPIQYYPNIYHCIILPETQKKEN